MRKKDNAKVEKQSKISISALVIKIKIHTVFILQNKVLKRIY